MMKLAGLIVVLLFCSQAGAQESSGVSPSVPKPQVTVLHRDASVCAAIASIHPSEDCQQNVEVYIYRPFPFVELYDVTLTYKDRDGAVHADSRLARRFFHAGSIVVVFDLTDISIMSTLVTPYIPSGNSTFIAAAR